MKQVGVGGLFLLCGVSLLFVWFAIAVARKLKAQFFTATSPSRLDAGIRTA